MLTRIILAACLSTAMFPGLNGAYAQDTETQNLTISKKILDKNYVFIAQMAQPMNGGSLPLSGGYELRISPDKVVAELPYFGRAYSAPYGSLDGGIKFNSNQFDYTMTNRKKGKWDISIKPKDVQNVQQLFLTVFEDGTARLQVTNINRQPISFSGRIADK